MNKTSLTELQRAALRWGRAVAAAGIVISCSACEVEFGGIQVKAGEPEYERPASLDAAPDSAARLEPLAMPTGPILFHVRRLDSVGRAAIEPIAELVGGELQSVGPQRTERADDYTAAFIDRYYEADQAYILFRDESRVGTFYVSDAAVVGSGICAVMGAEGQLELRPQADTLSEFLAWPGGVRASVGDLQVPGYREDMIGLSQVLARRGVTDAGIPGAWRLQAPADFRALSVGAGQLGFAATYIVGDSLGSGSPADSAGMVFVVADYSPAVGYFPLLSVAVWYGPGAKRTLRWLDLADLVGDENPEWLLRAYGDAGSWYEVVGEASGDTTVVWSSRQPICDARESTGSAVQAGG
jgi:hypothetical protein